MTKKDIEIHGVIFKNFSNISESERHEILNWRNDDLVRSMMISKDIISFENHLKFLENLKKSDDKAYWIAEYKTRKIGVVDLYNISSDKAFWGYYLNPQFIGSSYGILLEYLILEIAFSVFKLKELCCESLTINESVIKTHSFFGYSTIEEKNSCTFQTINFITFEKQKKMYELLTRKFWE